MRLSAARKTTMAWSLCSLSLVVTGCTGSDGGVNSANTTTTTNTGSGTTTTTTNSGGGSATTSG